jgi:hypothetical protein
MPDDTSALDTRVREAVKVALERRTVAPYWWPSPQGALALVSIVSVNGLAYLLVLRPVADLDDVAKMLIGGLVTVGFATIIGYYFGSSSGSKNKEDTINQIAAAATVAAPPPAADPANPPAVR